MLKIATVCTQEFFNKYFARKYREKHRGGYKGKYKFEPSQKEQKESNFYIECNENTAKQRAKDLKEEGYLVHLYIKEGGYEKGYELYGPKHWPEKDVKQITSNMYEGHRLNLLELLNIES